MRKVKCYKVHWDNGANACGVFDTEFETFEDADNYGNEWKIDMDYLDPSDSYDALAGDVYTYEIGVYFDDGSYELYDEWNGE